MTDKQIIIDGVDVSGCVHYIDSKNLDFNCNETPRSIFCRNNPDCYYKQLKRKEQECEELKEKLHKIQEHLETVSYLAPVTTRVLKHAIKTIIEE